MVKWLFFDLGSTIIDESDCDEFRLGALLNQPGAPDRGVLETFMAKAAEENRHPYKEAAKRFALQPSPWPAHLEILYPDTEEVLRQLKGRFHLGIIANQIPGTQQRLEAFGIRQYFDVILASLEVGCAKPDLRIFQMALEAAGCTPEEAVMIGDRLDNDIFPAAMLGMKTVWIRQGMFRTANPAALGITPTETIDTISNLLSIPWLQEDA